MLEYDKLVTRALLTNEKGEVLVGLRPKDKFWILPGGKPDPRESLRTCIRREIRRARSIMCDQR
jgi:8-oxo-dGTP pyrophosphatase MutT (NUDIX family)